MDSNKKVQCIIFRKINGQYEFLILKRIDDIKYWHPVTGKCELQDKNVLSSVYREIYEETGMLEQDILRIINVQSFEFEKNNKKIKEFVFGIEVKPNIRITFQNNVYVEHTDFRWVSIGKAISSLCYESQKNAFNKLKQLL
ncbi:NUDIX domain-containing protein [Candidatus Micrarchaeota archaeon]|jgi:8-oxo-dGTP pyrophosphatase MutT (NUDIX family)|nr:NUDIX domain-containing protein [Candidatus Micrarchaeota archaeon]